MTDVTDQYAVEQAATEILTSIEPHLKSAIIRILASGNFDQKNEPYTDHEKEVVLGCIFHSDWNTVSRSELIRRTSGLKSKIRDKIIDDLEDAGKIVRLTDPKQTNNTLYKIDRLWP